jgi:two-component sensor histidine kinase
MITTHINQSDAPVIGVQIGTNPTGFVVVLNPDPKSARHGRHFLRLFQHSPKGTPPRTPFDQDTTPRWTRSSDTHDLAPIDELPLMRALGPGEMILDEEWLVGDESGAWTPVLCSAGPIQDADGHVFGGAMIWFDMRKQKEIERTLRTTLLDIRRRYQEANHRIKNNLQNLGALLHLEARRRGDPEHLAFVETVMNRLQAFAQVHDGLSRSESMKRVDLADFLGTICKPWADTSHPVGLTVEGGLSISADQATPAGMIVSEAISNSLKHAFPDGRAGSVMVSGQREDDAWIRLVVADDGIGLPTPSPSQASLGLRLIHQLARQIGGTVDYGQSGRAGLVLTVRFPMDTPRPA